MTFWCPDGSGQALGHNPCLYISFIPTAASRSSRRGGCLMPSPPHLIPTPFKSPLSLPPKPAAARQRRPSAPRVSPPAVAWPSMRGCPRRSVPGAPPHQRSRAGGTLTLRGLGPVESGLEELLFQG
eukprot:gene18744-biopygen17440